MIPSFPNFKKIDSGDRRSVESFTKKYPPYSDFNFTSLWAWDTSQERAISLLDDNLVVKFTDYSTSEPFFSFLGDNKPEETIKSLLAYSEAQGLPQLLKLVPEISIRNVDCKELLVKEDRNNFDYILDIPLLSRLDGGRFKDLRRNVNRFVTLYPQSRIEITIMHEKVQSNILSLLNLWAENKTAEGKDFEIHKEKDTLLRLFETSNDNNLLITTILDGDSMSAFSVEEILPDSYCMGHFWKADTKKIGIYDFLLHSIAEYLNDQKIKSWNFEQDLGIENLRNSKMGYRPQSFLKKFVVSSYGQSSMV